MTRQRRWLRYFPALGVCLLPAGPNAQAHLLAEVGAQRTQEAVRCSAVFGDATVHGDEISGVEILLRACAQVQPDTLAGSLVCVLVQNPLAFQSEHRVPVGLYLKSPLDQMPIDPWTSFPGHAEGNITERLAGRGREIDK